MTTARDDLLDLFDFAWGRLRDRMAGLTDDEWRWRPVPDDDRITVRWRLDHITHTLTEERNATWLGLPADPPTDAAPETAADALARLADAYQQWRGQLTGVTDQALAAPIGKPGGWYGEATRYSFALHIVDELIHHAAEAALLRDLYAGRG
jgi:hypothetical protein